MVKNTRFTIKKGVKDTLVTNFDVSELPSTGLIGYTVEWFVKRLLTSSTYNIYKTNLDPTQIFIADAQAGTVFVYLNPEDTNTLAAGDYYFAFRLTAPDGTLITLSPDQANGELILLGSAYL